LGRLDPTIQQPSSTTLLMANGPAGGRHITTAELAQVSNESLILPRMAGKQVDRGNGAVGQGGPLIRPSLKARTGERFKPDEHLTWPTVGHNRQMANAPDLGERLNQTSQRILIGLHHHDAHTRCNPFEQDPEIRQGAIDQQECVSGTQGFGFVGSRDGGGMAFGTSRGCYGTHQQTPTRSDEVTPCGESSRWCGGEQLFNHGEGPTANT